LCHSQLTAYYGFTAVGWQQVVMWKVTMGGATGGVGDNVPHFWDQRGTGGWGRSNENDLCYYSRQSLFSTVQLTEFQLP